MNSIRCPGPTSRKGREKWGTPRIQFDIFCTGAEMWATRHDIGHVCVQSELPELCWEQWNILRQQDTNASTPTATGYPDRFAHCNSKHDNGGEYYNLSPGI